MKNQQLLIGLAFLLAALTGCTASAPEKDAAETGADTRLPVLFDTDANNELDDQHALAYLLFNGATFDVRGITVNATHSGGNIEAQYAEAERVLKLCDRFGKIPLYAGADGNFETIRDSIRQPDYDGKAAVEFIIAEARKPRSQKLVLIPVGKLTNIALALMKAPDIRDSVRIVWLGSNYPAPGEYNQENDIPAVNYVLEQQVPFEVVTVRYGDPSGSWFVRITPEEVRANLAGKGPQVSPVTGRHGDNFTCFGDYSVSLFDNIHMDGDPPGRSLFDLVAVAMVKNPAWGNHHEIPAPILEGTEWKDRPDNPHRITIWENFDKAGILGDFFSVLEHPELSERREEGRN